MELFEPLVSVLVPVYGVEKYIERCARSIFEQTYQNLEIIFVNDCTPDHSIDVLATVIEDYVERKNQTMIIQHDTNRGLAGARQTALNNSKGDYILTVDSDDWIERDMIEKLVAPLSIQNVDIVYCNYMIEYQHTQRKSRDISCSTPNEYLFNILTGKLHSGTCVKLIKKSLFTQNNITYINGVNMLEDMSIVFRLLIYAKKLYYVPEYLYHYFQGNENSYTATLSSRSKANIAFVVNFMSDFFNLHQNDIQDNIKYAFNVFRLATKAWLMYSSSSYTELCSNALLYPELNIQNYRNDLSYKNYIILFGAKISPIMAYIIIKILYCIKKVFVFMRNCR